MGLLKVIWRLYRDTGLRDDDVVIASFPRSGNTWVRFIFANIVSQRELGKKMVDFHVLNDELLYEYDNRTYSSYEPTTMPRFVKTHQKFSDGSFGNNVSLYVYRNPADVMVSHYIYRRALKRSQSLNDFSGFIRDRKKGLPAWIAHYQSWIDNATSTLFYRDLTEDPLREMSRVFGELGIMVNEDELAVAIQESDIGTIREREERFGRPRKMADFKEGYRFARSGKEGQYKDYFTADDVEYLQDQLKRNGLVQLAKRN